MLQLSGDVDNRDDIISDLETENESLKAQLAHEKQSGREGARAVAALRKQLTPLYQAMQMMFGHMEAINTDSAVNGATPAVSAVWKAWKDRLGGQPAQLIDALLLHSELTSGQIAIAIGVNPKNVAQVIHKVNKAGLLNKNGGKFSLKQL